MEDAPRQRLARAALVGAALLASLGLIGCEQPYERSLRLSCHWNLDIQLKGCARLGFKHCVDNCEYCVGAVGSPIEGRSDECKQLKCAAYCAKQDSEECLSTYRQLCLDGYSVIEQQGGSCNVNCNAAAPRSPRLLGLPIWLAAGFLAFVQLPGALSRGHVFTALLALAALHLQGCSDCPLGVPSLTWQVDLEDMDRFGGCIYEWDFVWGNPCASDVPVLYAKKGFVEQTDGDFVRGRVENEAYECRQRGTGGYCQEWTAAESGCDEEDFGICTCKEAGPGGRYCKKWQCISKEANQHICWKGCCGDSCDPCVECGVHGSSPFPMNEMVFRNLLASDGTASFILGTSGSANASDTALASLRNSHWTQFYYGGQCIMPRDVHSVWETPCNTWREIETEISYCECQQEAPGGKYCHQWRCEEKDVGMFSILFAHAKSYSALLSGMEEEVYTCMLSKSNGNEERCIKWKGDISSYEEVERTQCAANCPASLNDWCNLWVCNEYELPRVHDEDQWGKRLGFAILHYFWLVPPALFLSAIAIERSSGGEGAVEAFVAFVGIIIMWCVGFVRYYQQEGRWLRPGVPLLFMLLTIYLPYVVGIVLAVFCKNKGSDSPAASLLPGILATATFTTCASFWTTGIVGFLLLGMPWLCVVGGCAMRARGN